LRRQRAVCQYLGFPAQRQLANPFCARWIDYLGDDERLLDSVTALSGSGPAYFFLVMEALEQAGISWAWTRSGRLLTCKPRSAPPRWPGERESPAVLRARVTSPGAYRKALAVLQAGELEAFSPGAGSGLPTRPGTGRITWNPT